MADTIPQISVLWDYIGSAWSNFQDKQLIEEFWMSLGSGIQLLYDNVGNVQTSRVISLMNPTFDYGPQRFIIAYSGILPPYITSSGTNILIPEVTTLVPGAENITNTDFEINTSGWNISAGSSRSTAQAHGGIASLLIGAGGNWASYTFPSKIFAPLHFELWMYIPAGGSSPSIRIFNSTDLVAILYGDTSKVNQWQKVSSNHLTSAITSISITNNGVTQIYVDDISLKSVYSFAFQVDEWTYSIPTIEYSYTYNGIAYSGIYTEGIDYVINNSLNSVLWIGNAPIPDLRYSGLGVINGIATHILRINPVLANVWCRAVGLNIRTQYPNYTTFGQNKYLHLKMFAWACATYRRAAPSIYTLRNAYGVARGLPFAYASGILNWTLISGLYNVSIGGYTYIFPSGINPKPAGLAYNTFEIIGSGLDLWDYTTNAGLISSYTTMFNRNNFLLYKLNSSLSGLSFSQDFLTGFITSIMPEQVISTSA